jgi:integrase
VANNFEAVAREWFAARRDEWSASYGDKVLRRLEVDVFPYIGRSPIAGITPPQLLAVMRRIESRGVVETAHRALESCGQVFRYAVATGRAPSSPARDLKGALKRPDPNHFPAIVDPALLGQLLRAREAYAGTPVVRAALQLAPMLMLRPGELRFADWREFDLDAAVWTVPPARMKRVKRDKLNGEPHVVPLPTQAVALLRELYELTGPTGFVFRGERHHDRAMSNNTVNAALRAMGFPKEEVVGHGFRATARTMQRERLGIAAEVSEAQLAHTVRDPLGRAYNRAQFADERCAMLQAWADCLDALRLSEAAGSGELPSAPERLTA